MCRLVELLQNRGDHSTEANQTTTTLNALIKDGGQSKKASSVSLILPACACLDLGQPVHKLPLLPYHDPPVNALTHMLSCSFQQLRMSSTGMERRRLAGSSPR